MISLLFVLVSEDMIYGVAGGGGHGQPINKSCSVQVLMEFRGQKSHPRVRYGQWNNIYIILVE